MKKFLIAIFALAVVICLMTYNVWQGGIEPVVRRPGSLEDARADLHGQLFHAQQRESQYEKMYWDSPAQLRELITSHEQRIQKLAGNHEATEIVAHDRDSVSRLEKRIADIEAQRAADAARAAEQADQPDTEPSDPNR